MKYKRLPAVLASTTVGVIVVAGILLAAVSARKSADADQPADAGDVSSAHMMAEEFVKGQLKAPRTAKWPRSARSDGVSVEHLGGGLYRVRSWVDSQNSFGAMLRMHYVAEVRTSDGKNWSLVSLVTEP